MTPTPSNVRVHPSRAVARLFLLALASAFLLAPAPAYAADPQGSLCTGAGVNVVVDFQQLGGGTKLACDQQGDGKTAAEVFQDAGFEVTPVASFPGAACRVDGLPVQGGCAKMPPADAYWGLYVEKGTTWAYAPKGADQLPMTDGDFVAFSWQGTKTSTPPGIAPVTPTASASPTASAEASPASSSQDTQDSSGLAWWVPVVVVVLLVAAVAAVLVRRRGRPTP